MMQARLLPLGTALLLFGAPGCRAKDTQTKPEAPLAVQVMKVQPTSIARQLAYDADVQGEIEVRILPQVAERITSLPVEEGDKVRRGQVLAVLRADSLSEGVKSAAAAVDAARVELANLKDELKRSEALAQKNVVSRAQVDQTRARMLASEAQVRRLEAMTSQATTARSYSTVRAPIDGVVGRRYLSLGDMAAPSLPIMTVVQMDRVDLLLEVPEKDLANIREGMPASVRVSRYQEPFQGKVALIAPTIDRQTRTTRVKVRVENADHRLMPGMLARVSLEVERHDGVAVMPYGGVIIETATGGGVQYRGFVIQGNRARDRTLTLGIIDGPRVEVLSGLSFGEVVVTRGQQLLKEGREVEIVEQSDASGRSLSSGSKTAGAGRSDG